MSWIQVSESVRIERGPARKRDVATSALLDNRVTASHYFEGGIDAHGHTIEIGLPFDYLDWKGDWTWYIYRWDGERYQTISDNPDKDAALQAARELE